ncbi:hypothetical protein [Protofrankia symbiont of Coriaria ruscifolia]|uniref:hypothetical protein n=1 Tax=Protofrankia symbiont of Coriaria ruscifolia TaxID=1306542 RepID=UPI0010412B1C|nr:hypothetical protein [Protofrankia symbiont of Coriaria ruscifolia]
MPTPKPNDLLRRARLRLDSTRSPGEKISRQELADLVALWIFQEKGGRVTPIDDHYIGKLERGVVRWPQEDYRSALRAIFGARTDSELGFYRSRQTDSTQSASLIEHEELEFPTSWQNGIESTTQLWRQDMERRHLLAGAVFGIGSHSSLALRWLTKRTEVISAQGSRQVGTWEIDTIREMTTAFRRFDNRFGGGRGRSTLLCFLNDEVAPLLRDGKYSGNVAKDLFSAVAEITHLAGWMAYDEERHGLAQRYLFQALHFASSSDDEGFGGEILAGMGHQALYLGRPMDAIDLALAAQQSAKRSKIFSLLAESYTLEAHSHAVRGDRRACFSAMALAEQAFDRANPENEPEWIRYFDSAYMSAKFAHCLRDLGAAKEAEPYALRSLDMKQNYVRGRSFNMALLASIYGSCGEVDQACAMGTETIQIMQTLNSRRCHHYIRDVRRSLSQYRSMPVVREFEQASTQAFSAVS